MDASALGTNPITPEAPAGEDVRYDPDFEALQAEVDKMASPTAAGQVDWARVADLAAGILNTKSKDLNAAAYLAVALVTTRHISGLAEGTALIKALLETFWESLYPPKKRMRGRAGAITWWLEKTENALARISPPPLASDLATRLKADLKAIDSLLAEKMPDAPLLAALQRRIEALPVVAEASAAAETATEKPAPIAAPPQGGSPPAAAPAPAPSPSPGTGAAAIAGADAENVSNAAEARRAADMAMQHLRRVSLFLLQQNSGDPLPYRYRRLAGWARVTAAPPVNKEGNTAIAPPPPQVISQLETLRTAGNPEALLLFAEPKISQCLFCFDLHRDIAEALADLGDSHRAAEEVVVQETAALLRRLPELVALRFSDGTPFADPRTHQWIERITGATAAPGAPAVDTAAAAAAADATADVVAEARAMARRKQLIDAVALLQRQMNGSASGRQALCWRLAIIRLLLENKKAPAALPHVDRVLADLDRFAVASWEPDLAVEAWTLAWQVLNAQSGNEHKARAAEMLHHMAAVDPAAALRNGQ